MSGGYALEGPEASSGFRREIGLKLVMEQAEALANAWSANL